MLTKFSYLVELTPYIHIFVQLYSPNLQMQSSNLCGV